MKTTPQIQKSKVVVDAVIPLQLTRNQTKDNTVNLVQISKISSMTEMSNFQSELNFKYSVIYDWSKEIIQIQAKNPDGFPITAISDIAFRNNFTYDILTVTRNTGEGVSLDITAPVIDDRNKVLIALSTDKVYSQPYYFTFGILYNINYSQFFAEDIKIEAEVAALEAELNESG